MKRVFALVVALVLSLTTMAFASTSITNLPELTKDGTVDFSKLTDEELALFVELATDELDARTSAKAPVDTASATMGEKNALQSAQNDLDFMAFSRSGLIDQLEFDGYSTEEATYAVDNCGADWKEQAVKSAENYLSFMSFSRSGLIDQLVFDGYTKEQAEYGAKKNGY